VVEAFSSGSEAPDPRFPDGVTVAIGLRVPRPFAGKQILSVLRESKGGAVAVSEKEILSATRSLFREGVFACPEGGATLAGHARLVGEGTLRSRESCLLYNTGTGLKYLELLK
jgi:threonine synthase